MLSRLRGLVPSINAVLCCAVALGLFAVPAGTLCYWLADDALRGPAVPKAAWSLFRALSPGYARWARGWLAAERGTKLELSDISGTEWPLFGSVFYLLAVENLQRAYEADPGCFDEEPRRYARPAIEAAVDLVLSPISASWVRRHWGDDYMEDENCFHRMLVIWAASSHMVLTGERTHEALLREQATGLARIIDASPHGWIEDYPAQTYPTDIIAAIAAIERAHRLLAIDDGDFVERAKRGFTGARLDETRGLPPYSGVSATGRVLEVARGCGNAYAVIFGSRIWPAMAATWMDRYEAQYWQHRWLFKGFREFPKDLPGRDWGGDVDAGPIVKGHGVAACAFGVAAVRCSGRFDLAWPLTAEMLVSSWPLPTGTWLMPRVLSNAVDAPLLGEACTLFCLTCLPKEGVPVRRGGSLAGYVYILLAASVSLAVLFFAIAYWGYRRRPADSDAVPSWQLFLWAALISAMFLAFVLGEGLVAVLFMLLAQLLPRKTGEQN